MNTTKYSSEHYICPKCNRELEAEMMYHCSKCGWCGT